MALFTFPASFFFLTHLVHLCICEHLCSLQLTTFWSLQYILVETMEEDSNRGTVIDLRYACLNYSLLTVTFNPLNSELNPICQ